MFRKSSAALERPSTPNHQRATKQAKLLCRRNKTERRVSNALTKFPMVDDVSGVRINNDRRFRPDRRYAVEIKWLRD